MTLVFFPSLAKLCPTGFSDTHGFRTVISLVPNMCLISIELELNLIELPAEPCFHPYDFTDNASKTLPNTLYLH